MARTRDTGFLLLIALVLPAGACGGGDTVASGADSGVPEDPCSWCSADAVCSEGQCSCAAGYTGDGETCTDIDECATDNGGCHADATCTNTPGSRVCTCNEDLLGDGVSCAPLWTDVVSLPGLTLSSFFYAAGAGSRIYFAGGNSPDPVFKSLDPETLDIRDETSMVAGSQDLNGSGLIVSLISSESSPGEYQIHAFGDYGQVYDCQLKTWLAVAYPGDVKHGETGAASFEGAVLLVGGRGGSVITDDKLSLYDAQTNSWQSGPSYPVPVNWPAAAMVDGRFYATGGKIASQQTNTLLAVYEPGGDNWTVLAEAPFENLIRPSGVAHDGRFWVFTPFGEAWIYDPATAAWFEEPVPAPEGNMLWKPVDLDGELYLVGTSSSPEETRIVHYTGP